MLIQLTGAELKLWKRWMAYYQANGIQITPAERTEAFFAAKDGKCPHC